MEGKKKNILILSWSYQNKPPPPPPPKKSMEGKKKN